MKKVNSRNARVPAGGKKRVGVAKSGRGVMKSRGAGRVKVSNAKARPAAKPKAPETPALQIRELDPLRICGDRTSVTQLYRVDEPAIQGRAAGARQVHLVFNDRHGWYCEHGRSCHAVSAVMRHAGIRGAIR